MCAPAAVLVPLIGMGLQGASSIVNHKAQAHQAALDQAENDRLIAQTHAEASESTRRALQDLDSRELEDMLAAANANGDVNRQTNQLKSTAIVAAGEAGVTGQSIDELLNDVQAQEGRVISRNNQNLSLEQAQLQRQREAAVAAGNSQYNSVQKKTYNQPSPLVPILQIAGAGLSAADDIGRYSHSLKVPIGTP